MPRGRPRKIKIDITPIVEGFDSPILQTKTRLQELEELHQWLIRENITSISKLEAMISQLKSAA